jgi:heat shock protein HslJ
MRPDDLDDPAPIEPDEAVLSRVHARSSAFRRRRRAQRVVGAGAAALVIVLAVAVAIGVNDDAPAPPSGPPQMTTSTTQPPITAADLEGAWRPRAIAGYDGALTAPPLGSVPLVRFVPNGRLNGTDGCNEFSGHYDLQADGTFRQRDFVTTNVGCPSSVAFQDALGTARRVEVRDNRLLLLAADGRELAQLARPEVTARIELPSDQVVAGGTMKGRVVVDNETGRVIPAFGCGSLFAVMLTNAHVKPPIAWTLCRQTLDIPTGVSTYPVQIRANTSPVIGPADPLPPGRYEATLYQSMHVVPDPPRVIVEVIAAP